MTADDGEYNPEDYWEQRLTERFELRGVGNVGFNERYNRYLYRMKSDTLEKAIQDVGLQVTESSVCDVGSGIGFFIDFYLEHGAREVFGLDITGQSVDALRTRYPDGDFEVADISDPNFEINHRSEFDIVNAFDVIYHIVDDAGFKRSLENISTILAPRGVLFITDRFKSKRAASHVKFRDLERYQSIFDELNLNIVGDYPLFFLLNRPIFGGFAPRRFDNTLAPIYYFIDKLLVSERRSNLRLLVAQFKP